MSSFSAVLTSSVQNLVEYLNYLPHGAFVREEVIFLIHVHPLKLMLSEVDESFRCT